MGMEVLQPGPATSVQDAGRPGYSPLGIPLSGALDQQSLVLANLLVGNDEGAAVIESTLLGPEQRAFDDGRTFVVADQQVCEHQALLVERTRQRNAQVVVAGAAGVLHAGREAGLEHFNRHGALSGAVGCSRPGRPDRKSTRLNSSHS